MGQVKNFFHDEIEYNALEPIDQQGFSKDCEQDIWAYREQLRHIKTYSPYVVKKHRNEMVKHLIELAQYLGDIK